MAIIVRKLLTDAVVVLDDLWRAFWSLPPARRHGPREAA